MWRQINPLLVGFGQERCRAIGPACDGCGIRALCPSAVAAEGTSDGGGDNEYLAVPYADKDEAKALGARWDGPTSTFQAWSRRRGLGSLSLR